MPSEIRQRALPTCPSCGNTGKPVKAITIGSLVVPAARLRVERVNDFRFCAEPSCFVVYYHAETGARITKDEVRVRIGQKETEAPRLVCYCFEHTVEEIEAEVARTGTSRVGDEIAAKCRQGLDRCEETNPQGSCCLGNVRRALKAAQAKREGLASVPQEANPTEEECCDMTTNQLQTEQGCCAVSADHPTAAETPPVPESPRRASRLNAGGIAQIGALASAILASACCWLPLLLIAVGASGGALSATFETWRPFLLPVTFVLLGTAFYFAYRKPRIPVLAGAGTVGADDECCAVGAEGAAATCCPPEGTRKITLKKINKVMLWVVATFVLAFAFFPNYVGALLGGLDGQDHMSEKDVAAAKMLLKIEGMTCAGCASGLQARLRSLPGVNAADVDFDSASATVMLAPQGEIGAVLHAIKELGFEGTLSEETGAKEGEQ